MSPKELVDNAAATTAIDDKAASSTEDELELSPEGEEEPEVQEEAEAQEEEPKVEYTRKMQKRIDGLVGTIKTQGQQLDRLQRKRPLQQDDGAAPNPDDFDSDVDYARADATYEATKAVVNLYNQSQVQDEQEQANFDLQQRLNAHNVKIVEIEKDVPDFRSSVDQTMLTVRDINGNYTPVTMAILEAENGPQIELHIAKNPELEQSLNQSTPVQAAMKIATLSAQLTANPAKINKNPEPIGSEGTGAGLAAASDGLLNLDGATFE